MNELPQPGRHRGLRDTWHLEPTWIGFIILGVVAIRSIIYYRDQSALLAVALLLAAFGLLYVLEMAFSARFSLFRLLYFPLQTAVILALSRQQPFLDVIQVLYIPLSLQAFHAFSSRIAAACIGLFALILNVTLVLAMGWLEGLALGLLIMAVGAFLLSYDRLDTQMQSDQEESQRLLAELQQAHQKLQEHAGRAEELAAARERNLLARELHDSVSQTIFAITLTSQSARLLLEREPNRVPEQLDRLQGMATAALNQLRSLIAQLRPPPAG